MTNAVCDVHDAENTEGYVFNVQHFSIHDGPGIRSTVFLNGCLLHCAWCHNPESNALRPYLVLETGKCRMCHACEKVCPQHAHTFEQDLHIFQKSRCVACGRCVAACHYGGMHWIGSVRTAKDVFAEVRKDRQYFLNSGGGITVSGGEPALQPDFVHALFTLAHAEGIHCCMETSGFAKPEAYERLQPLTDLFLFDCKETDPERHKQFTGADLSLIQENLLALDAWGAKLLIRCPIIPGCNVRQAHLEGIAALCKRLHHLIGVELLPYHALGVAKAHRLGLQEQQKYQVPAAQTIHVWNEYLKGQQLPVLGADT